MGNSVNADAEFLIGHDQIDQRAILWTGDVELAKGARLAGPHRTTSVRTVSALVDVSRHVLHPPDTQAPEPIRPA